MEQIQLPKQDYKVLVRCYTYNQAPYIEDALTGFVMQQTDFPFVCLVVDDCSTDGEQEVIKTFLNRECYMEDAEYYEDDTTRVIYVQHKTNTNCFIAVYLLKENLYNQKERKMAYVTPWRDHCLYEALCEGDDYWCNPLKLQKQVDYLDEHNDCGLVYCGRNSFIQSSGHIVPSFTEKPFVNFEQLLFDNFVSTLTVCLRLSLLSGYIDEVKPSTKGWKMGDYPIWLWFSLHSDLHFIPDIVATYRVLEETASHTKNINKQVEFTKSLNEIRSYFATKSGVDKRTLRALSDEHNCAMGAIYFRWRKYDKALSYFIKVTPNYFIKRVFKK